LVSKEVTLLSFDQTLALVGGYAGTVWLIIYFFIGSFQTFSYHASLTRKLYTRDHFEKVASRVEEEDDAKEIGSRINIRKQDIFHYFEYLYTKLVSSCCCCLKRTEWYKFRKLRAEAHAEVFERLSNEIDIFNFIQASRALKLMTSTLLRTNQRHLIKYFKQYHISYDKLKLPEQKKPKSIKKLTQHFDPINDVVDKRILYEITGRKEAKDKFSDDEQAGSDEDEETSWFRRRSFGSFLNSELKHRESQKLLVSGGDDNPGPSYTVND